MKNIGETEEDDNYDQQAEKLSSTLFKTPVNPQLVPEFKLKYPNEKNVVKISNNNEYLDALFSLINPGAKIEKPLSNNKNKIQTKAESNNAEKQILDKEEQNKDELTKIKNQNLFDNVIPNQYTPTKVPAQVGPNTNRLSQLILPPNQLKPTRSQLLSTKTQLIIPNNEASYQTQVHLLANECLQN